jgi:hypothetical protein
MSNSAISSQSNSSISFLKDYRVKVSFDFTYLMDGCVFKFVLVICIENDAALVDKAHDWRDPAGAPEEVYDYVEKPVLDDESEK